MNALIFDCDGVLAETERDGELRPRPGIARLAMEAYRNGWRLAVASTSEFELVAAVLEIAVGRGVASKFEIFAGDVVTHKKPAPDVYEFALGHIGIAAPDAIAIESSRNGMLAAVRAGVRCVVTVSTFTRDEDFSEAQLVVSSLGDPGGERTTVLADRGHVEVDGFVSLETLVTARAASRAVS